MKITLTIKSYRCFADTSPATITLNRDFIAVLGVNNAGKSTLLRFFYELRHLFVTFAHANEQALGQAFGNALVFNYPNSVILDPLEIFSKQTPRDLEISLRV